MATILLGCFGRTRYSPCLGCWNELRGTSSGEYRRVRHSDLESRIVGLGFRRAAKIGRRWQPMDTILVVEDEIAIREMLGRGLRQRGYEVLVAEDGDEALRICSKHPCPIHVLLCDVVTPGLGARELIRIAVGMYPSLKVHYEPSHSAPAGLSQHSGYQRNAALIPTTSNVVGVLPGRGLVRPHIWCLVQLVDTGARGTLGAMMARRYRCRLATSTRKQGAKVRIKGFRNFNPCEPSGWRGSGRPEMGPFRIYFLRRTSPRGTAPVETCNSPFSTVKLAIVMRSRPWELL
jgi:hypothetical protein